MMFLNFFLFFNDCCPFSVHLCFCCSTVDCLHYILLFCCACLWMRREWKWPNGNSMGMGRRLKLGKWKWEGMRFDWLGMGGKGNAKIYSRSSDTLACLSSYIRKTATRHKWQSRQLFTWHMTKWWPTSSDLRPKTGPTTSTPRTFSDCENFLRVDKVRLDFGRRLTLVGHHKTPWRLSFVRLHGLLILTVVNSTWQWWHLNDRLAITRSTVWRLKSAHGTHTYLHSSDRRDRRHYVLGLSVHLCVRPSVSGRRYFLAVDF